MQIINPHAAGIDVGSRFHLVGVGQNTEEDVRQFGVYSSDLAAIVAWLKVRGVTTVAMESTGTYWQSLYAALAAAGFEVFLCNGKFTKNMKGKKSDVQDCQWIQKLHSLGMLTTSFLPSASIEELRTYCRLRSRQIDLAAATANKMQKNLRLLNLRLDVVVKDITGVTGLSIIRAVCRGETCPEKLSGYRHGNCKKSKEEIALALQSNGRKDYLFALQQELEMYDHLQTKISACDAEIDAKLKEIIDADNNKKQHSIEPKPHKKANKNAPKGIDMNLRSYQMFEGADFLAIEGVSYSTLLTLMSEVGIEGIRKFNSAKQFASWLRLAPNNKVSGGKVLSSKVPKGSNRLKITLRNAANTIGNLKEPTPLRDFFQRINFKKGRVSAISATARKLAVIIWNMATKGTAYSNQDGYQYYEQKRKLGLVKRIKKQIEKYNLSPDDLGLAKN